VQKATADGKCPACGAKVDAKMMSTDACPHCEGVQKATADGKCPACEAKKAGGAASATPAAVGGDACTHCPGVQTASADGKCPECGMALAK
jgi:hypothetical protein